MVLTVLHMTSVGHSWAHLHIHLYGRKVPLCWCRTTLSFLKAAFLNWSKLEPVASNGCISNQFKINFKSVMHLVSHLKEPMLMITVVFSFPCTTSICTEELPDLCSLFFCLIKLVAMKVCVSCGNNCATFALGFWKLAAWKWSACCL